MTFGDALQAAQEGKKVARSGWNGKGMFICYSPGSKTLTADKFWSPAMREFVEQNGGEMEVLPLLLMKTADNKVLMGWLASQSDMLATDWEIV